MEKVKLEFSKIIQDSQEYGSDNEHMISRVFFTIDDEEFSCTVRQPYGESFSFEHNPIEVDPVDNLKDALKYGEYKDAVEKYFRMAVGNQGQMIQISGGTNIRMKNNTFVFKHISFVEKAGFESGW